MWLLQVCGYFRSTSDLLCKDSINRYRDPSHGSLILWGLHCGTLCEAHSLRLARLASSSETAE